MAYKTTCEGTDGDLTARAEQLIKRQPMLMDQIVDSWHDEEKGTGEGSLSLDGRSGQYPAAGVVGNSADGWEPSVQFHRQKDEMTINDWLIAVAREVVRTLQFEDDERETATGVVMDIIDRHDRGRYRPPPPRCNTCRLWARADPKQDGICTLWKSDKLVFTTSADFGCVRWEKK